MKKKVKLEGFPLVAFTGKIVFPDGGDLYVKFGTDGLTCEQFVVEIEVVEGKEGEPVTEKEVIAASPLAQITGLTALPRVQTAVTSEDVLTAFELFSEQVEDVVLARLGALCDKTRARVESVRSRGLGPRDGNPRL